MPRPPRVCPGGWRWLGIVWILVGLALAAPAAAATDAVWQRWRDGAVRGVNVQLTLGAAEIAHLRRDWGVNALRVQLELPDGQLAAIAAEGLRGVPRVQARLLALLDDAHAQGVGVVLDLHRAQGGAGQHGRLWHEPALQDALVQTWRMLAQDLRGHPALWGYDILNEPTPPDDFRKSFDQIRGTLQDWNVLAQRVVRAIRGVDPAMPLIVESTDWAKPFRFRQLERIADDRVVYSFHMYAPYPLTHQGIAQFPRRASLRYPGVVDGRDYDREQLRRHMHEAIVFARRHDVPVFVGEFGINAFADDASREHYLRDLLALFGESGFSWAYHAYRIWDGWMPTAAMRSALRGEGLAP